MISVSGWRRAGAYDPSIITANVYAPGSDTWAVRSMGEGQAMCVKRNGRHVGMADWEDWTAVTTIIERKTS